MPIVAIIAVFCSETCKAECLAACGAGSTVPSGTVRITADNVGSYEHELIIAKGTAASLPRKPNGSIDEDAAKGVIGEIGGVGVDGAHLGAGRLAVVLTGLDDVGLGEGNGRAAHHPAGGKRPDHSGNQCLLHHESIPY